MKAALIAGLKDELVQMSRADRRRYPNRSPFIENPRAREIGVAINEMGGFRLMQVVASRIAPELKYAADLRDLDYAWNGIGAWEA